MSPHDSPDLDKMQSKLRIALTLCLLSYAALLLLFVVYNITTDDGSVQLWLVQSLPLMIFIPGILRTTEPQSWRTYSWLCFVILIYFTHAVTNCMSPLVNWKDIAQLGLSISLFISAMMTSRWLQRSRILQQETTG